jgi:preprotein translocase subunit SecB
VDLRDIRLILLHASCQYDSSVKRHLRAAYDYSCVPAKVDGGLIEVECSYDFHIQSSDAEIGSANLKYYLVYQLLGDEPAEQSDIEHFARANGAYHSWPFVRETIHGLTAKMGFPPYTLPVLSFMGRPKPSVKPSESPT